MNDIEHVHEKVLVSALLFEAAGKSSATLDSFSNWLLAGFAAVVTFLLSNLDSLAGRLPPEAIGCAISLFLAAAVFGIFEKLLAVIIAGATAGAAVGRTMGAQAAERGIKMNADVIFAQTESGVLPPMRWFVKRSFAKAASGDLAAASRSFLRCAQIQGILVFIQTGIVLWAVYVISRSLLF